MPDTATRYTRKDFQTDQEVRWCPGCGDYTILASVQNFMAGLDIDKENVVFVSGIGCASRFPYYMDTFGMHSIHGRAPAIASGIAAERVFAVGYGETRPIGDNETEEGRAMNRRIEFRLGPPE